MSYDLTLYIATELEPSTLLTEFAEINRLERRMENFVGDGVVVNAGAADERTQRMIEEPYGFRPTAYLFFTIDKAEGYEAGLATTLFGSIRLLNRISGDAVLNCWYENVVLARLGVTLRINSDSSFWTEQNIAKLDSPYVVEPLPDID
jgi:hypothetical protein